MTPPPTNAVVRDECAEGSWEKFNELLEQTPALNRTT